MKDVKIPDDFLQGKRGGTELAPMSTTTSLAVALEYCASPRPLLFRLRAKTFMQRGAGPAFLSCFPDEAETLFPPLTYLNPCSERAHKLRFTYASRAGQSIKMKITVVDVEPFTG